MARSNAKEVITIELDTDAIRQQEEQIAAETDEEIITRINERFDFLDEMTLAVKAGDIRAMIVSGPPGVGKSFGIEKVLEKDDLFNTLAQRRPKYEIVKGAMSSVGLYAKLYKYSDPNHVIVLDDCDSVLVDEESLNILKGALDSSARRWISWNKDSRLLRQEDVPDRFEFRGSAIFVTNIKFSHVRSKRLKDHLAALESRCHYVDLNMDTVREKLLRIKYVVNNGGMLDRYGFTDEEIEDILSFTVENQAKLRELSLRMVIKIADLRKSFPTKWTSLARTTCMTR